MNLSKSIKMGALGLCVGVASSFATTILYSDLGTGTSATTGGAVVTAVGGNFTQKTVAGDPGTGIDGGLLDAVVGEINYNEKIIFNFSSARGISSLDLDFLYTNEKLPEMYYHYDAADEFALVDATDNNDSTTTYKLQITGNGTATWTPLKAGTSVSCQSLGGGEYDVLNPFGSDLIKQIVLKVDPAAANAANSHGADFAFKSLTTVPEPSSVSLLLVGMVSLLGMGIARKKK